METGAPTAPSDWLRRLCFTVALVGVAHAVQFIAMPWLDWNEWDVAVNYSMSGWMIATRDAPQLGIAALGLAPLASALSLTTLVFCLAPKLRRSLDEAGGEARLLRAAFVVSVVLAILQSNGIALFLSGMSEEFAPLSDLRGLDMWLIGATLALSASLYAALPFALERWGLCSGLSAAVLLYCLFHVAQALHAIGFDLVTGLTGVVQAGDVVLFALMIAGTVAAVRRWIGDSEVLPGDPRVARIGSSLSIGLIAFMGLNGFGGPLLVQWAAFDEFGASLLELGIAVGGGLLLATRSSAPSSPPIAANKLLALGTFVLLIALATMLLTDGRLPMPWAETVIATILIYMSWRADPNKRVPAS